jgi:hypothetical protein
MEALEQLRKRRRELENEYHYAKSTASGAQLYEIMRAQAINAAALEMETQKQRAKSFVMKPYPTSYVDRCY